LNRSNVYADFCFNYNAHIGLAVLTKKQRSELRIIKLDTETGRDASIGRLKKAYPCGLAANVPAISKSADIAAARQKCRRAKLSSA